MYKNTKWADLHFDTDNFIATRIMQLRLPIQISNCFLWIGYHRFSFLVEVFQILQCSTEDKPSENENQSNQSKYLALMMDNVF